MQVRIRLLALLTGGALAISGPLILPAQADSAPLDACSLINAGQASRILGVKITVHALDTSAAGPNAATMCRYSSGRVSGGFMLLVARLRVADLAHEIASEKREIRSETSKMMKTTPKITDVADLGDAAFLVDTGDFLQLHVFAHGNKLVVNRTVRATKTIIDQTEQLARVALARLK